MLFLLHYKIVCDLFATSHLLSIELNVQVSDTTKA